ncbi:MAG: putative toxin-antitoxin system toxin component, PIN family [Syntrophales bacterium]|nr:putative toxin-antitoxin system toxin component, PIN family [Syntrophales bacterium]
MRIILDTNVFVSGVFFTGPPYEILKGWRDGKWQLIISPEILDEYRRVGKSLAEQFPGIDLGPTLELVTVKAAMFSAQSFHEPVCADPDDDKFFACALAGKSKVIVSGDKHLLQVSGFREIRVLKPREFVDEYLSNADKR